MDNDWEDSINVAILNDDLEEFVKYSDKMTNWENYYIKDFEEYFMHSAVRNKAKSVLHYMKSRTVDWNLKDKEEKTVLHLAIEEEMCEVTHFILKEGKSNVSVTPRLCLDRNENNELHKWVTHHSTCEVCLHSLIQFAKNTNNLTHFTKKNLNKNNPLFQAIIEDDVNSVKLLVKILNFDLNETGENENTVLHMASMAKSTAIFDYLVELNIVDLNKRNCKLHSALTVSLIHDNYFIAEKLVSMGAYVSSSDKRIAFEKSNKNLYSKLKVKYEEQQKSRTNKQIKAGHHSNAESKSIVVVDEDQEDLSHLKNSTAKKLKQSQDLQNIMRGTKLSLDSNSNNSNTSLTDIERKNSSQSQGRTGMCIQPVSLHSKLISNEQKRLIETAKRDSEPTSQVQPFINGVNPRETSHGSNGNNLILNTIINSPFKTGSKSPNRAPIGTALQSNFFLKDSSFARQNAPSLDNSRRYSTFLNKYFNFDSLVNFEYIKSFTNLSAKDLIKEELIYSADICQVYRGKYLCLPVAIKMYNIAKLKEEDLKYFLSEVNLLMSLRHPHIVTFIGTCLDSNSFHLVTEYMEKKSLKNVIENKKISLSTSEKVKVCYDVAIAILYLHTRTPQVFHRDLKSSNCLVDSFNKVKLCDFGLSKIYEELKWAKSPQQEGTPSFYQTNCTGTSFWMAPEFITDNLFTDKADIYAFGILMWEVMMRDPLPLKNISEMAFLCGEKEILSLRPEIPQDFDKDIRSLMESCWHADYKLRPDIATVVRQLESLIQTYKIRV